MADDKARADYAQPDLHIYDAEYQLLDDIWDCLATREQLMRYLPRRGREPNLESWDSYLLRLKTTNLPRVFRDGIERAVGRFGVASFDEDTPDVIKNLRENIDGNETNLDTFVFQVLVNLLRRGCMAIVVDIVDNQPRATITPISSIKNRIYAEDRLQLLTVEHVDHVQDKYAVENQFRYMEYRPGQLLKWTKDSKTGELNLVDEFLLTDAAGNLRDEVYAVWLSVDPNSAKWKPCAPPFLGLAKESILQMLKVSELNRAETICNMQVLKRYHPQGVDPAGPHPDIDWDPEAVQEIPFGGDLKVDEPAGTAIAITHTRNKDRADAMDRAVDSWLTDRIRTATESEIADEAEKSRLEIITKAVQQAMEEVFRYMLKLSDRRMDPTEAGGITMSATAYNAVTDSEIQMATDDFSAQALTVSAIRKIKLQQWQSRGYDLDESDLDDETFPAGPILNGGPQAEISTLS